ncbi:MAG: carboxypeptidase-like regulatory domain-containing protein [Acidobacteriota bacterium]
MTLRSKFARLFLAIALLLPQLSLAGFADVNTGRAAVPDTITGTLKGYVLDPGGLGIPSVSVRVINVETGNTRATRTNAEGLYQFALLPLGAYRIEATKDGYIAQKQEKESITLKLNQPVEWAPPIKMLPATDAQAIAAAQTTPKPTPTPQPNTTTAKEEYSGSLVNLTDSTRRANADERMVALLPLSNIRSFDDLALLAAGVAPPPQVKGVAGPGIGAGIGTAGQFAVNGQRARSNNFTVDGSDNNDEDVGVRRQGFVALTPQSIESVKEIQIVTHLWDAEQGRSMGSQVNAVSKSGTNQIHGSLYDFFNHDALNARNFFDYSAKNAQPYALTGTAYRRFTAGQPDVIGQLPVLVGGVPVIQPNPSQGKDQFQRNQGGATLGFPIFRDKTFFFGSYERQDIKSRQETHFSVPTVAQRGFLNFGASGFKTTDNTGGVQLFTPTFAAGNSVLSLFPFPNNPVGPYGENTYTQVLPADAHGTIYSLKFDHTFRMFGPEVLHTLTGRYNFTDDQRQVPVVGGALFSGVMPQVRTQNLSLFLNSQLSPSKANQIRASYGRTALNFNELRDSYLRNSHLLPNEPYLLNVGQVRNANAPSLSLNPPPQTVIRYGLGSQGTDVEDNLGAVGQVIVAPFSPVGLDVYLFPQSRANNTIQVADTYTWFRAQNIYKFGADIRRTQLNSALNRNYRPQVIFAGTPDLTAKYPQAPLPNLSMNGPTPGYFSGTDLASLGIPTNIFQSVAIGAPDSTLGLRFWQLNFFGNDNWQARRGLTLDFGMRYELNTVPRDVNSRIERTFRLDQLPTADPALTIAIPLTTRSLPLSNEALLRSYNATISALRQFIGNRDGIFDSDRNNFGGHFGFAWDPLANNKDQAGKTSIRGGVGVYYDLTLGSVVSQSRNVFPNFLPFNVDASTFAYARESYFFPFPTGIGKLNNPIFVPVNIFNQGNFVGQRGVIQGGTLNTIGLPAGVIPQVLGLLFDPSLASNTTINGQPVRSGGGLAFTLPDKNLRSPYALQYNLQIERELFSDFLVNLAYVGTRGIKLTRFRTPNGGPNSITVPIDPLGLNPYDSTKPETYPLPAIALPPLSDLANKKFSRPNAALGAYTIFDSSAASTYHSLQLGLTKRFAQGLQLTAAYTWSHAIDDVSDVFEVAGAYALPQDDRALRAERASANFDIRHRLAISILGNAPLLGRFDDAKGAKGAILGGWQYALFTTYQTGQPFTVNTSYDVNLDGNLTDRLDTLNGLTFVDSRREKLRLNTNAVNLLAPVDSNGQGGNGRIGRNTFRASGVAKTDFTVIKNIRLTGGQVIVFRAEAFNIFNRTHFALPVRVLEAPSFGQSVDTLFNPRQIQFALKYVF